MLGHIGVCDGRRIDVDRFGQSGGTADPRQSGVDEASDHEVWISRLIERLDFEIGCAGVARGAGDQPQRRLAILQPPDLVRTSPMTRDQSQIAGEGASPDRQQARQVGQDASGESLSLVGHLVSTPSTAEQVAVIAPERDMHMAAVADTIGYHLWRERGVQPVPHAEGPDRLTHEDRRVRGPDRILGGNRNLVLGAAVFRMDLIDRHVLPVQGREQVTEVV